MNDELDAVRRSRPAPVRSWAVSAQGQAVLDTILTRTRTEAAPYLRQRRRRMMIFAGAGAGAAVLGLTGAGLAVQLPFMPGPQGGQGGMCARTLSAEADLSELPPGEHFDPRNPAAACARHWDQMWGADGTPRPKRFAACYHRTSDGDPQGGAVVYPADGYRDAATACAAIGFVPVEQNVR